MLLNSLTVTNFKNIAEARLEFSPNLNGLLGLNGMGKSNLLDAIFALSFTKSYSGMPDRMLVRNNQPFFLLKGEYTRRGLDEEVTLGLIPGKRKTLKRKGKEYNRIAEHIGAFPLVMISPRDIDLVRGTGSDRRRWLNMVISQSDAPYLDALMRYNATLEQRNKLLRDGVTDRSYLEVLDYTLDATGMVIHSARVEFVKHLSAIFARYYAQLAGEGEAPMLSYESPLNTPGVTLTALLRDNLPRDYALHHTSVGPHRDDMEMTLWGMPVRQTASEGQCKSITIALRLAQYEFLREATHMQPLLLLDDIFDKLDATRVSRLVNLVSQPLFGQIFVTDTNRKHLDEILSSATGDVRLWSVDNGTFTPIEAHTQPAAE